MGHEVDPGLDGYEDEPLANAMAGAYRRGGERGVRRLQKNVLEIELRLDVPPAQAEARARDVLSASSRMIRDLGAGPGRTRIAGIVGSGALSMNPTVVMITISAARDGSLVTVRGAAKEGLIKHRAGEKAGRRIADALT
jgi:hypothetical protein